MSDSVIIRDANLVESDGWKELSAEVDGERIWFKITANVDVTVRAEPFIAAGLLEAMVRGVPLVVEGKLPLSAELHSNLQEIQEIYRCWNTDLTVIPVNAVLVNEECDSTTGIASFYSAGVDSSHTFLRHRDEIDTLLFMLGFDGDNSEQDWDERIVGQQKFADQTGKKLVVIKTNARQFALKRRISWNFGHGLCLATIAPMLKYKKVFIPSSHTYDELFAWGSHPLSDPLWSTEASRVVHDAAGFRRSDKMRDLCGHQEILDNLQVCWRSSHKNCGTCPKCVRTMLALDLLKASCSKLPPLEDEKLLRHLKAADESGATFIEDAMLLAKQEDNLQIYKQLKGYYKRYQMSQVIPLLDRIFLNSLLKRLYRRVRKPDWLENRVSLRAKDRWSV